MPFTPFNLDVTNGKATKQNLDAEVNRALSELDGSISSAALGIENVNTVAEMNAFYADPDNRDRLVYVRYNNSDPSDPANGVYEYTGGAARPSSGFTKFLEDAIDDLVDEAVDARDQSLDASAAALEARDEAINAKNVSVDARNVTVAATDIAVSASNSAESDREAIELAIAGWGPGTGLTVPAADRGILRALNPGGPAYLYELGREGEFVWSSDDLSVQVASDPLEGVYVAPLSDPTGSSGAWVRRIEGVVYPKWWGASIAIDTTASLQAAINFAASTGGAIDLGDASITYSVTAKLNIPACDALRIFADNAEISSDQAIILDFQGATCSNVIIDGVKFSSTLVSSSGTAGLIYCGNKNLRSLKILNCEFTCPSARTGAIKLVHYFDTGTLDGLVVQGCKFKSVGQMGVEILNHTFDGVERYRNVLITDNEFDGLGEASPYGMAVSFSGEGTALTFSRNKIRQANNIAIESVGAHNASICENQISDLKSGCSSLGIGMGSVLTRPYGMKIANNQVSDAGGGLFQIVRCDNSSIEGNVILGNHGVSLEDMGGTAIKSNIVIVSKTIVLSALIKCPGGGNVFESNGSASGSYTRLSNSQGCMFVGDTFRSKYQIGLNVNSGSTGNEFDSCLFDIEGATSPSAPLQFSGATTTANRATNCRFNRGASGFTWAQTSGATGNLIAFPRYSSLNLQTSDNFVTTLTPFTGSNAYRSPIAIGTTYLWTNSGRLRISTTIPAAATDGNAIPIAAAAQSNSTATDVAGLVSDFNALLAKLRTSGALST